MKCPSCGDPLPAARYLGVPIRLCEVCDSLWVTSQNLDVIKKTPRTFDEKEVVKVRLLKEWKVVEGQQASPFLCPQCSTRLIRGHYKETPGLILDSCPRDCGHWLGKDGLQKIQILEVEGD